MCIFCITAKDVGKSHIPSPSTVEASLDSYLPEFFFRFLGGRKALVILSRRVTGTNLKDCSGCREVNRLCRGGEWVGTDGKERGVGMERKQGD